ncbi:MAG: hypothetical protein ACLUX8_02695 [Clostridium sp.]|jgi:hypothetical protein
MFGIYPYSVVTDKQKKAMETAKVNCLTKDWIEKDVKEVLV